MGYNIADRDVNNKTARDIAAEKGIQENVDAIGNYVECKCNVIVDDGWVQHCGQRCQQ